MEQGRTEGQYRDFHSRMDKARIDSSSPDRVASKRGHGSARRALDAFARFLSELARDDGKMNAGLLQGIDARAKVLGLVGLIVVCTGIHNITALLVCCVACAVLAMASGIALRRFAGAWLAVPLFSAAIMLPPPCSM